MNTLIRRRLLMSSTPPTEVSENWNINYLASNGLPDTNLFTININGESQNYSIDNDKLLLDSDYESGYIELVINNSLIRKNVSFEIKFYQSSSFNNYDYGLRLYLINKNKEGICAGTRTNGGVFNYTNTNAYGEWLATLPNGTSLHSLKINIENGIGEIFVDDVSKLNNITLEEVIKNKTILSKILISQIKIYISEIKFNSR